jgi:hypothetical protein
MSYFDDNEDRIVYGAQPGRVRRTTQSHHCHWPDCTKQVPPKMWGCKEHWFRLPKALRDLIWATYVPGQEIRKDPSPAYIEAANKVQQWIKGQSA